MAIRKGKEERNKTHIVESLYARLINNETETVAELLAPDLEWWFHGPPGCEHMMKALTGADMVDRSENEKFRFVPKKVVEVGKWIVAEGWEGKRAYWVHLWVVEDGVITQFREYFNTALIVRELKGEVWQSEVKGYLGRPLPGLVLAI